MLFVCFISNVVCLFESSLVGWKVELDQWLLYNLHQSKCSSPSKKTLGLHINFLVKSLTIVGHNLIEARDIGQIRSWRTSAINVFVHCMYTSMACYLCHNLTPFRSELKIPLAWYSVQSNIWIFFSIGS